MAENQGPITQDQLDIARQFEQSAKRAAASYRDMAGSTRTILVQQLQDPKLKKSETEIREMLERVDRVSASTQSFVRTTSTNLSSLQSKVSRNALTALDNVYSGIDSLFSNTSRGLGQGIESVANGAASMMEAVGGQLDGFPAKMSNMMGTIARLAGGVIGQTERFAIGLTRNYERRFVEPFVRINNNIRSSLGALSQGAGRAAVTMRRTLGRDLRGLGITTNFFGVGIKGAAERARFLNKSLSMLGSVADNVLGEFGTKAAVALGTFQKAGFATEQQTQGIVQNVKALGGDPVKAIGMIIAKGNEFGERFGITANFISRDISMMMADFGKFGNLSVHEMAAASTFARKLGTDISKLTGVISTFDDFEAAATNVAKLSQAFGVNVDAVKMMNAENPAERVQMLRDAFFAAGKSAENMTRQELALISSQTGLDASTARLVFSQKNRFQGERDLQKQMEKRKSREQEIKEAPLKMAESFQTLNMTLERVFIGIDDKLKLFSDNLMLSPAGKQIMGWARGVSHESAEQFGRLGKILGNTEFVKDAAGSLGKATGQHKAMLKAAVDNVEDAMKIMDVHTGLRKASASAEDVENSMKQIDTIVANMKAQGIDDPAMLKLAEDAKKALLREGDQKVTLDKMMSSETASQLTLTAGQAGAQGYAEGWNESMKARAPEMMGETLNAIQKGQQAESPALLFTPAGHNSAMGWMKGWVETTASPEFAQQAGDALMTPIASIASIDNMQLQPVSDALSTIGKNAENVKAQLSDLNVQVDNFSRSGVGELMSKGQLSINTEGFSINVNVHALIDGEKLASTIAEQEVTIRPVNTGEGMTRGNFAINQNPAAEG